MTNTRGTNIAATRKGERTGASNLLVKHLSVAASRENIATPRSSFVRGCLKKGAIDLRTRYVGAANARYDQGVISGTFFC
jgi:hypothetical protein